jgi:glutamine synthetase
VTAEQILALVEQAGIAQIRVAWCDLHGEMRAKSIMPQALKSALHEGVGMVGTLALKDTSDRTAFKVFEPDALNQWPGLASFAHASNCSLKLLPETFKVLPWAAQTAWIQGELRDAQGHTVALDARAVLRRQLQQLKDHGYGLNCGLEIEFHIYKIESSRPQFDPELAAWPGLPPALSMIHPGYRLLSERWLDACDEALQVVRQTCKGLGLPLCSLEIEFGPSQVEAVFGVQDALSAADTAALFRAAVTQALRRAGYHASFICRPPFDQIMSSGWHLHQSLSNLQTGQNAFTSSHQALSSAGQQWLAGLLSHSAAICALANPGIDAYARFRPNALAPTAINWAVDARSALLRVIPAGQATRIENRIGSPMANPYLYIASQVAAGLDGLAHRQVAPAALDPSAAALPSGMLEALHALQQDCVFSSALGAELIQSYLHIKKSEYVRYSQAQDPQDWLRREYFSRY